MESFAWIWREYGLIDCHQSGRKRKAFIMVVVLFVSGALDQGM